MIFADKMGVCHSLRVWSKDKYSYMVFCAFLFQSSYFNAIF